MTQYGVKANLIEFLRGRVGALCGTDTDAIQMRFPYQPEDGSQQLFFSHNDVSDDEVHFIASINDLIKTPELRNERKATIIV